MYSIENVIFYVSFFNYRFFMKLDKIYLFRIVKF